MQVRMLCLTVGLLVGMPCLEALVQQDVDAPAKPGECAVYFVARDKHSNTYQMTCSDPQPDAITIEHAATDSQHVYTSRAH